MNLLVAFKRQNGFPSVIGALDGTHIVINTPNDYPEVYINRKGSHSIHSAERVERELLEQCSQILVECFAWLQRCDKCIKQLEELSRVKRSRFTVANRRSVMAKIARLAIAIRKTFCAR
ncbi:hypothetical protein P5V15_011284 [Pogonomyrmex californicus]